MDQVAVVSFARALIDIDSTTGRDDCALRAAVIGLDREGRRRRAAVMHEPDVSRGKLGVCERRRRRPIRPVAGLLERALRDIRAGDILMAHLGIWSRQDPWAPAVLEPLISGLKQRGLCFATLRDHPDYRAHLASTPQTVAPPANQPPATP